MFALRRRFAAGKHDIDRLFLTPYRLEYITEYFSAGRGLRVLTYPLKTSSSYEKAQCLGSWSPLNVIKTLYLQSLSGDLYGIVVPETGCFLNKEAIRQQLGLDTDDHLVKARSLPRNMEHGTCSPFLPRMISLTTAAPCAPSCSIHRRCNVSGKRAVWMTSRSGSITAAPFR